MSLSSIKELNSIKLDNDSQTSFVLSDILKKKSEFFINVVSSDKSLVVVLSRNALTFDEESLRHPALLSSFTTKKRKKLL